MVLSMLGRVARSAAVALLIVGFAAPLASGSHCDSKITVYGRSALTPLAPPPYTSATGSACARALGSNGVDEHRLPPNTDQIMVRVHGDYGPSVPTIEARFDGLGFVDSVHPLQRTLNAGGLFSYNLAQWLSTPAGATDGELKVTVLLLSGARTVSYNTTATFVIPPPPPPP